MALPIEGQATATAQELINAVVTTTRDNNLESTPAQTMLGEFGLDQASEVMQSPGKKPYIFVWSSLNPAKKIPISISDRAKNKDLHRPGTVITEKMFATLFLATYLHPSGVQAISLTDKTGVIVGTSTGVAAKADAVETFYEVTKIIPRVITTSGIRA